MKGFVWVDDELLNNPSWIIAMNRHFPGWELLEKFPEERFQRVEIEHPEIDEYCPYMLYHTPSTGDIEIVKFT